MQALCTWCFSNVQTFGGSPAWTKKQTQTRYLSFELHIQVILFSDCKAPLKNNHRVWIAPIRNTTCERHHLQHSKPTCFPPPLLGRAMEDMEGPDAPPPPPPPPLLFPVQLLQRISPWFPFFHIEEEFVLQTAQHGFKPSGIVSNRGNEPR